jgi:hypothetical protein
VNTRHSCTRPALVLTSLAVLVAVAACGGAAATATTLAPSAAAPSAPASVEPSASATATRPASDSASPAALELPTVDGPLAPGTYAVPASAWSVADYIVTVPDGWGLQQGNIFGTTTEAGSELGFAPFIVDEIFADACAGSDGETMEIGPSVDDLVTALAGQTGPSVSGPVPTSLGGHEGTRVDLTVPEGFDLHQCNVQDIGLQLWYSEPADKNFVLLDDSVASIHVIDVGGRRQVLTTLVPTLAAEPDLAKLAAVLDSIRIAP